MTNTKPLNTDLKDTTIILESLTKDELDAELMKGYESIKQGKTYTADEVDALLKKEFGI